LAVSAVLVLFAGPTAVSGDIIFDDFSSISGLNLQGDALQVGDVLRVQPAQDWNIREGTVWFQTQQPLAAGFETMFHFRLSNAGGVSDGSQVGGDGFAFMIQASSATAQGNHPLPGVDLGYGGIPNSIAIEFDTFRNGYGGAHDPSTNHVAIMSRGTAPNTFDHDLAELVHANVPGDFNDGIVRVARVLYEAGTLSVFVDDLGTPLLSLDVDIPALIGTQEAWVGFTAARGDAFADHDILSWSFLPKECLTDIDGNFSLDTRDIILFLNLWVDEDPLCDWNHDGVVDTRDVNDFLDDWVAGC